MCWSIADQSNFFCLLSPAVRMSHLVRRTAVVLIEGHKKQTVTEIVYCFELSAALCIIAKSAW